MPIYAYRCSACGHAKDVLQKLSDAPLTQCPACGEASFAKQLTAAGFQLKGSGWYVTDFRNGAQGGAKAGADGSQTEAKGEAKGEAAQAEGTKPESGKSDAGKGASPGPGSAKADGGGAKASPGTAAAPPPASGS